VALDKVVAAAAISIPGSGARVSIDIPDDLPLVLADPGLLERVFFNLIDNALRHGGPDTPVVVRAIAAASSAKIEVTDAGPGIDAEHREAVFEPFRSGGDRSAPGGLGLGLSIARGFVEAMGGALIADNATSGGTTMRIRLPLAGQ
jgi:two-component system sensor histidine kinase KdpD